MDQYEKDGTGFHTVFRFSRVHLMNMVYIGTK